MSRLLTLTLAAAVGALAYRVFLREPVLNWGARPDEVARRLPGDDLLETAEVVATRAITIDAPPSAIWPWLLQMGPGRGGVYTYDWIENLFGLDMHSADRIVPEWQSMEVGYVWRNPQGEGMRVEVVDPERAIVMRSEEGSWVWAFVLEPEGNATRFISRNRFVLKGGPLERLAEMYLMEPGSLVMERKMLLGIKSRAEKLARERAEAEHATVEAARSRAHPGRRSCGRWRACLTATGRQEGPRDPIDRVRRPDGRDPPQADHSLRRRRPRALGTDDRGPPGRPARCSRLPRGPGTGGRARGGPRRHGPSRDGAGAPDDDRPYDYWTAYSVVEPLTTTVPFTRKTLHFDPAVTDWR